MDKIGEFVLKKRKVSNTKGFEIKEERLPWYKRPIERTDFHYRKGKDGKLYVQHNEWSKKTWIGPYDNKTEVENIVESYVMESLKAPLHRKTNSNIHSITVDDEPRFFEKEKSKIIV